MFLISSGVMPMPLSSTHKMAALPNRARPGWPGFCPTSVFTDVTQPFNLARASAALKPARAGICPGQNRAISDNGKMFSVLTETLPVSIMTIPPDKI
jgi:hypothetical protein